MPRYLMPVLIWCEGESEELAYDHIAKLLHDKNLSDQVPFCGSGRECSREQIEDPDFGVAVAYGEHWLTNDDDPRTWPFPPKPPKEPATDDG